MEEIKRDGVQKEALTIAPNKETTVLQNGGYVMHTIEDVQEIYFAYIHDTKDRDLIMKAYEFVKQKHAGIKW